MTGFLKKQSKGIVAIVCPEEEKVMQAVNDAVKLGLGRFILFGNEEKIKKFSIFEVINSDKISIISTVDKNEAIRLAIETVSLGNADVLMKGLVDTGALMKEFLKSQYGLRSNGLLSHIMVMEIKKLNRLLFLSDGGMNINPNVEEIIQITLNAINFSKSIGISCPKVALLSAVEKVNPKLESSLKCQAVSDFFQREVIDCEVFGPLSLDIALSKEAAKTKGFENSVAGEADILIAPFLEVANVIYKTWVLADPSIETAGIVFGGKIPVVLTSRSDSYQTKLNSIALALSIKGIYEQTDIDN
jgi:phosphate butyryltransferase